MPPLSLPDSEAPIRSNQVAGFDSVTLLVERAAAVQPGFAVDEFNAAQVQQLCKRLDGMPLALEVAAVRLEGLSVDQLLADIGREMASDSLPGSEEKLPPHVLRFPAKLSPHLGITAGSMIL